jgi:O-acetylhomoserine (thiol)-lyase
MTHSHLSDRQLGEAGISQTTVRISIGLEDPDDLVDDLDRALAAL